MQKHDVVFLCGELIMLRYYDGKNVIIMSCSDCNTSCRHCYISYSGDFSSDTLYETAYNLKKNGYSVLINGTEPLLHEDYLETYKLINQKMALTNGLVFRDNFSYLDKIKSYGITGLNISYHFNFHDDISNVSAEYLRSLWKEILSRNMRFSINCTISTKNMQNILDYCNQAFAFGAFKIRFANLLRQGAALNFDNSLILNNFQINYVLNNIEHARKKFPKEKLYVARCGSLGPGVNNRKFYCPAGIDNAYLTPDFKVYPCFFLSKPGYEIGLYKDGKIFIDSTYQNDGKSCKAAEILNNIYRD